MMMNEGGLLLSRLGVLWRRCFDLLGFARQGWSSSDILSVNS